MAGLSLLVGCGNDDGTTSTASTTASTAPAVGEVAGTDTGTGTTAPAAGTVTTVAGRPGTTPTFPSTTLSPLGKGGPTTPTTEGKFTKVTPPAGTATTRPPTGTVYATCDAARAAGVAPLQAGDPGYTRELDRDGDGIACD